MPLSNVGDLEMRNIVINLALCFFSLCAFADVTIDIGAGARQDSLNFNIADPTGSPDVLSELEWKDLHLWLIEADFKLITCRQIYLRLRADYGMIYDGKNRDSDYAGDDRTLIFSEVYCNASKGEAFDLSAGIGYQFLFWCDQIGLTPLVGYSHSEQHLRMYDGFQKINAFDPLAVGPFPGLHSNYRAKWSGPWLGFDLDYSFCDYWKLYGGFEYHWAFYRGTGHWNLRTDFIDDFKHRGHFAHGTESFLGLNYDFWGNLAFGVKVRYQTMRLHKGMHRVKVAVDGGPVTFGTRLNEVNWHAFSVLGLLSYQF